MSSYYTLLTLRGRVWKVLLGGGILGAAPLTPTAATAAATERRPAAAAEAPEGGGALGTHEVGRGGGGGAGGGVTVGGGGEVPGGCSSVAAAAADSDSSVAAVAADAAAGCTTARHLSCGDYLEAVARGPSGSHVKIRNDVFRTFASDAAFRARVGDPQVLSLLAFTGTKVQILTHLTHRYSVFLLLLVQKYKY